MYKVRVALIGTGFMGRAHSNAYLDVSRFFNLPANPEMVIACDIQAEAVKSLSERFGWEHTDLDWEKVVTRDDIDLVDICTSNATHMPIALAAAKAGKHIICEKPIARNATEARAMLHAAREANIIHMVAHNYRRVPAIALARQLIDRGEIGRVLHFNAVYYQDWQVDPTAPFVWRNDASIGGSGVHGDMNAHIIDLARYLVGEIESVSGVRETFIKERKTQQGKIKPVTAEDSAYFLAKFQSGALGSFLVTKMATGFKNYLRLEVCGTDGSFIFNLERLNELQFYTRRDDHITQGFRTILVTEKQHPYMDAWWPPGHIIGWEHTFIHEIRDMLVAIDKNQQIHPDFYDGLRCQLVIDAASQAMDNQCWVTVPEGEG